MHTQCCDFLYCVYCIVHNYNPFAFCSVLCHCSSTHSYACLYFVLFLFACFLLLLLLLLLFFFICLRTSWKTGLTGRRSIPTELKTNKQTNKQTYYAVIPACIGCSFHCIPYLAHILYLGAHLPTTYTYKHMRLYGIFMVYFLVV